MTIRQLIANGLALGSAPENLRPDEMAARCTEIDPNAAEVRERWTRKPRRGRVKLPKAA